jgi:hypothetical protein
MSFKAPVYILSMGEVDEAIDQAVPWPQSRGRNPAEFRAEIRERVRGAVGAAVQDWLVIFLERIKDEQKGQVPA